MKIVLRNSTKYVLDILLLLSGFVTLFESYVVWFVLPHGVGMHGGSNYCSGNGVGKTGNSQYFIGLPRNTWISIHNWTSVVLFCIVMIHIVLHWSWIVETTKRITSNFRRSTGKIFELYGAVMILFGLFVFECLSGLVLWLALPRGALDYSNMTQGNGRAFLALQRSVWVNLHAWIAVLIVSIIIVHLILNWNWAVGFSKKIFLGGVRSKN